MELQKESERRGWPPASMIDQTVGGVENNTRAGAETSFFKFHTICSQNPCSGSIIRKSYIILMHAKKNDFENKLWQNKTKPMHCSTSCLLKSLFAPNWVINDMWWMTFGWHMTRWHVIDEKRRWHDFYGEGWLVTIRMIQWQRQTMLTVDMI